jgi:isoprenylcysteine carboxyl methyltransferase (ICMT) family protein YpbQ
MAYGIYGSNKNVRNSVLTEFRGHPNYCVQVIVGGELTHMLMAIGGALLFSFFIIYDTQVA